MHRRARAILPRVAAFHAFLSTASRDCPANQPGFCGAVWRRPRAVAGRAKVAPLTWYCCLSLTRECAFGIDRRWKCIARCIGVCDDFLCVGKFSSAFLAICSRRRLRRSVERLYISSHACVCAQHKVGAGG